DGKTIVFYTLATNLGSTATAGVQVYLYDNDSSSATYQQLKLISHTPGSTTTAGNGTSPVSPSSSFFFYSGTSAAPSGLALPGVSANGQYITYLSNASNLVSGFSGTAQINAFLYDRGADTTTLVSHANSGAAVSPNANSSAVAISGDGSTVAFF